MKYVASWFINDFTLIELKLKLEWRMHFLVRKEISLIGTYRLSTYVGKFLSCVLFIELSNCYRHLDKLSQKIGKGQTINILKYKHWV